MTVDKKRKIFKHTRGEIAGRTFDPADEEHLKSCTDAEIPLSKLPLTIYIRVQGDLLLQSLVLEPQIYGLSRGGWIGPYDGRSSQRELGELLWFPHRP